MPLATPGSAVLTQSRPGGGSMRVAGLVWALLHVPVILGLYWPSLLQAVRGLPRGGALMWPAFTIEAGVLLLAIWVAVLPASPWIGLYRRLLPIAMGVATLAFFVDSRVYRLMGFHVNGFFFRVLMQPKALDETGVPLSDVATWLGVAAAWTVMELAVGGWFLKRFASSRPAWKLAVVVAAIGVVERVGLGGLAFFGGPAFVSAGQTLPMQIPVRVARLLGALTGRRSAAQVDPLAGATAASAARLPPGVPVGEVRFERKPDIVLVIAESLPVTHFGRETMPLVSARASTGAVFDRFYAAASATNYSIFSLLFGLEAHKQDAVVGAGLRPLLFSALKAHGYRTHLLAASSVDWMGMKETVFGEVGESLETQWQGDGEARDTAMFARAREHIEAAGDAPLFVLVFMDGTHYRYTYRPRSAVFGPVWAGKSALEAGEVEPVIVRNRAKNAAREVDTKVDELLARMEIRRGKRPLVFFTSDHGEEYGEKGRIGHSSTVTEEQIHVPLAIWGDGVSVGHFDQVTSHVDFVPTLFGLLGDKNPPERYSDGWSAFAVPPDRVAISTVGWEPRYAIIGADLKVSFHAMDAGLGGVLVTDPWDQPFADGDARFAARAPQLMRALGR